ncbi:PilZ domain-containing protein [Pseudomonas cremoricolorata]|uniref:PilZ domain-containing protein n=1 Tax=Pseudomonas cremoricolorata TaxID=157783 RepID=UPI00041D8C51|nr:PilZ domain-containing protein [Pseudomonas cremoricolorata]
MSGHQQRRRFQRIPFDATTELCQDDRCWPVSLLDLSLKGLLIAAPDDWDADRERPFQATVHLAADAVVRMQVELRHHEGKRLGFHCLMMDIDSISHLHRLVELNLADGVAMQRELSELIED